ncbi:hypothetical protein WJX73_002737 [Symbiochloris irregularis]|uniref:Uncharacterized protein n=1 Tax=Symbiochloris irregularis TaxID=706552 RepID=A0AAW1NQE8_9CHLO
MLGIQASLVGPQRHSCQSACSTAAPRAPSIARTPCLPSRCSRPQLDVRASAAEDQAQPEAPSTSCQTCGIPLSQAPRGCDREGRIAGGLGAVLGFDWWPIKAYRPCPELAKGGFNYTRRGQITDEILIPKQKKREQQ